MRPRPLTILLLLLAGAVVNVGVAWGLAIIYVRATAPLTQVSITNQELLPKEPSP